MSKRQRQSIPWRSKMDCFASLAMTKEKRPGLLPAFCSLSRHAREGGHPVIAAVSEGNESVWIVRRSLSLGGAMRRPLADDDSGPQFSEARFGGVAGHDFTRVS